MRRQLFSPLSRSGLEKGARFRGVKCWAKEISTGTGCITVLHFWQFSLLLASCAKSSYVFHVEAIKGEVEQGDVHDSSGEKGHRDQKFLAEIYRELLPCNIQIIVNIRKTIYRAVQPDALELPLSREERETIRQSNTANRSGNSDLIRP